MRFRFFETALVSLTLRLDLEMMARETSCYSGIDSSTRALNGKLIADYSRLVARISFLKHVVMLSSDFAVA
jgi:hypothetical protein